MFDVDGFKESKATASALLLFDQAMKIQAIKGEVVCAAHELNRLSDSELSELGINRSDIEATIARYI